MPVRIVSDSSCDLTTEETSELNVGVVPLSIRFGDEEFTDRVQLTPEEFYRRMAAADVLPETAAPSPGAFVEAFRAAAATAPALTRSKPWCPTWCPAPVCSGHWTRSTT